jgi:hypothetical protein|tara:strand:- start:126 stop:239 length:114 start_codon:yes stop_codon:yes gene_type:complete
MTPGIKKCKDYYTGGGKKESKKETIENKPKQVHKEVK